MNANYCSLNGGEHRYFIFKTYEAFELVPPLLALDAGETGEEVTLQATGRDLYQKVEYAVLGCNCSSVVKKKVRTDVQE